MSNIITKQTQLDVNNQAKLQETLFELQKEQGTVVVVISLSNAAEPKAKLKVWDISTEMSVTILKQILEGLQKESIVLGPKNKIIVNRGGAEA